MKTRFYLATLLLVVLAACGTNSFKKGDKGLEYKIISDGSGETIGYGNFVQLHFKQVYKGATDTVISDSRDYMPRINMLDSISTPPEYFKILKLLRKGDSLVLRTRVDSFYKRDPTAIPPYMKHSDMIYTSLKIVNIFETQAQADSANKAEAKLAKPRMIQKQMSEIENQVIGKNKQQWEADIKKIEDYLAKNNIKATKSRWGTYVNFIDEGVGEKITTGDVVMVKYTAKTFDSSHVVDSNMGPNGQPYQVNMSQFGTVVLGWHDALFQMRNKTKAVIYIPSTLAYGKDGRSGIKPNENLVFDMEIVSVENEEAALAKQEAQQKILAERQRALVDSMNKAQARPNK